MWQGNEEGVESRLAVLFLCVLASEKTEGFITLSEIKELWKSYRKL